jgi:hypothetical protein
MMPNTVARLLVLSAFAIASAASAEGGGGFRGRGVQTRTVDGYVLGGYPSDYGTGAGYGIGGGNGYGDWYGISSGHQECPQFRRRVKTPDGWRVEIVPVC